MSLLEFQQNNPNDQLKLAEIVKYPNINIRLNSRENLYAINRDFEEVVVCAASKSKLGDVEIAGMGSILEEHVKLFAGVLEDTWIQSRKVKTEEIMYAFQSSQMIEKVQQPIQQTTFQIPKTPSVPIKPEVQIQPTTTTVENNVLKPFEQKPTVPTQPTLPQLPTVEQQGEVKEPIDTIDSTLNKEGTISQLFDDVINLLDKKIGREISSDLEHIRNRITEEIGYTAILGQIGITIASLKTVPMLLSSMEVEETLKKINFWRKKINI